MTTSLHVMVFKCQLLSPCLVDMMSRKSRLQKYIFSARHELAHVYICEMIDSFSENLEPHVENSLCV